MDTRNGSQWPVLSSYLPENPETETGCEKQYFRVTWISPRRQRIYSGIRKLRRKARRLARKIDRFLYRFENANTTLAIVCGTVSIIMLALVALKIAEDNLEEELIPDIVLEQQEQADKAAYESERVAYIESQLTDWEIAWKQEHAGVAE